jgi:multiple sugar transport system substrate-binding protein
MKRLLQTIMFGAGLAALASVASAETKVQLVEVITSPQRTEFLRKELDEFEKGNPYIKV